MVDKKMEEDRLALAVVDMAKNHNVENNPLTQDYIALRDGMRNVVAELNTHAPRRYTLEENDFLSTIEIYEKKFLGKKSIAKISVEDLMELEPVPVSLERVVLYSEIPCSPHNIRSTVEEIVKERDKKMIYLD